MTARIQKLSFLVNHISFPAKQLMSPGPNSEQLEAILQSAMSAPDHGALAPFRFLTIQGKARNALGEVFAKAAKRRGLEDSAVQKQRSKPMRSPLIICVIASLRDAPTIPQIEQILCAGSATQHIQLACSALGYGSVWLTGENSYDLQISEALGLETHERIISFIYVGTPTQPAEQRKRANAKLITQQWTSSQHIEFAI